MMKYNNPQGMEMVGKPTPKVMIYKSESHKLHQSFMVKKGEVIYQSMPVMLNTDGTISPYLGEGTYLGIATTDSLNPCYPGMNTLPEVTVMVEGFAIIYGQSSDKLDCGGVKPEKVKEGSFYVPYAADAENEDPKFIALNPAEEAGELVQILVK